METRIQVTWRHLPNENVMSGMWLVYNATVKVFQFLDLRDPAADDFQNLNSSFSSTDTYLVKFS